MSGVLLGWNGSWSDWSIRKSKINNRLTVKIFSFPVLSRPDVISNWQSIVFYYDLPGNGIPLLGKSGFVLPAVGIEIPSEVSATLPNNMLPS